MRRLFVVATAFAMVAAGSARAQTSAAQSTTATVRIVQPISLAKTADLGFGTVVKPSTGANSVTISTVSDAPTLAGPGNAALMASPASRAAFTVGGEGGAAFSITVPPTVTMTRSGGAQTIAVNLTASSTSGTLSGSAGTAGSASFAVGGAFTVSPGTTTGAYAGAFNTTVAYN